MYRDSVKIDPNLVHCDICGDATYKQLLFFYEQVSEGCCPECLNNLLIAEEVLAIALKDDN